MMSSPDEFDTDTTMIDDEKHLTKKQKIIREKKIRKTKSLYNDNANKSKKILKEHYKKNRDDTYDSSINAKKILETFNNDTNILATPKQTSLFQRIFNNERYTKENDFIDVENAMKERIQATIHDEIKNTNEKRFYHSKTEDIKNELDKLNYNYCCSENEREKLLQMVYDLKNVYPDVPWKDICIAIIFIYYILNLIEKDHVIQLQMFSDLTETFANVETIYRDFISFSTEEKEKVFSSIRKQIFDFPQSPSDSIKGGFLSLKTHNKHKTTKKKRRKLVRR